MMSKRKRPVDDDAAAAAAASSSEQAAASPSHDVVCLDVGGTRFYTNRSTLTSHPGSMLAARFGGMMMAGGELPRDELRNCDVYFIDRSPVTFARVLQYLRTGKLSPQLPPFIDAPDVWRELRDDAAYYGLEGLTELLHTTKVRVRANTVCASSP